MFKNHIFFFNLIYSLSHVFIKKITFKGKGYKLLKKKHVLYFFLNHAHITWSFFFNIICKKLLKYKYIYIYKNINKLLQILHKIIQIRFLNIFTKRGLRFSKQKVFKKIGKRTS